MSAKQRIFISSVQKELALERRAIKDFIRADPLLSRFFEVFLFEDLPPQLTVDNLRRPHASIPRSPRIAEPLFLARYIEKAGTGTLDMISQCAQAGLPAPEFRQDGGQFIQTLWRLKGAADVVEVTAAGTKPGTKSGPSRDQVKILAKASTGAALTELMTVAERTNRTKFRDQVIQPLMDQGLLEMTLPDKPTSSQQKYRLTVQGAAWLVNRTETGNKK